MVIGYKTKTVSTNENTVYLFKLTRKNTGMTVKKTGINTGIQPSEICFTLAPTKNQYNLTFYKTP